MAFNQAEKYVGIGETRKYSPSKLSPEKQVLI